MNENGPDACDLCRLCGAQDSITDERPAQTLGLKPTVYREPALGFLELPGPEFRIPTTITNGHARRDFSDFISPDQ